MQRAEFDGLRQAEAWLSKRVDSMLQRGQAARVTYSHHFNMIQICCYMNLSTGWLDAHDLIWAWPQLLVFVKSIHSAEEPLHPALKCHASRAFQSGGAKLKIANNHTRLQHDCELLKTWRPKFPAIPQFNANTETGLLAATAAGAARGQEKQPILLLHPKLWLQYKDICIYIYIELSQPLEFLKTLALLRRLTQGAGIGWTVCAEIVEVSRKFIHP